MAGGVACARHHPTLRRRPLRSSVQLYPTSAVGIPKLPKPSTRSPGLSSSAVAGGSASGGFLARSESGVAPRFDRGVWGALRSVVIGLLLGVLFIDRLRRGRRTPCMRSIIIIHGAELWLGVDKILAPFRETVKI